MPCKCTDVDWDNAAKLFRRQPELRGRLEQIYQHVQSGLYQDEDPASFAAFVTHLRSLLSLSPRTVLRQALHGAVQEIRKGEHRLEVSSLLEILNLDDDINVNMSSILAALEELSPGQRFLDRERLQEKLVKSHSIDTRRRIVEGFRRQKKENTAIVIEAAISRALEKEKKNIDTWKKSLVDLEKELGNDEEFRRYTTAQDIFQNAGLRALHENYQTLDLAICQKRGKRGVALEEYGCQTAFSMIVLDLQQRYRNLILSDFTYQRNVFWWRGERRVGEIDLCVLWRKQVISICELKSSCFEITIAMRQHEAKLDEMLRGGPVSLGDLTACLSPTEDMQVRLYVATLLPTEGREMVGVEPAISNAICAGIRDQNLNIANVSTASESQTLIQYLLQSDLRVSSALSCVRGSSIRKTSIDVGSSDADIDYQRLRGFVEKRIGRDILQESPLTCFKRCSHRTFVLSPNDSRLRNNLDPSATTP